MAISKNRAAWVRLCLIWILLSRFHRSFRMTGCGAGFCTAALPKKEQLGIKLGWPWDRLGSPLG